MLYRNFSKYNDMFLANPKQPQVATLDPGCYEFKYNQDTDQRIFQEVQFSHDTLIDLPSKEYNQITSQIDHFLKPETKKSFKDFGFLYKRSILMHGLPGTGKTCLANRIANKVVQNGGIVLFNPEPSFLSKAFEVLSSIQPDTTVVVIFEELDALVKRYEDSLLNLLDGEIQRENVIYLGTTNYINEIPARILRPGRFSNVVEVKYPTADARKHYLNIKVGKQLDKAAIKTWVTKTKGYSIDELKESILSVHCLDIPFSEVDSRIKESKKIQELRNKDDERRAMRELYNTNVEFYELQDKMKQSMMAKALPSGGR